MRSSRTQSKKGSASGPGRGVWKHTLNGGWDHGRRSRHHLRSFRLTNPACATEWDRSDSFHSARHSGCLRHRAVFVAAVETGARGYCKLSTSHLSNTQALTIHFTDSTTMQFERAQCEAVMARHISWRERFELSIILVILVRGEKLSPPSFFDCPGPTRFYFPRLDRSLTTTDAVWKSTSKRQVQ